MRTICGTILAALLPVAVCAATYKVDIDRSDGLYRCGETATFTVRVLSTNALAEAANPCSERFYSEFGAWTKGTVENEDKAYGELYGRIVERIRLWPGLAPHETESSPGRFAYDAKKKVWRRHDVSQPELVILRPTGKPRDTMVVAMPPGGYHAQNVSTMFRNSKPILDSGRWVAVLHYRIPRREGRDIYAAPREDAARAIRILRANAKRLGFSPEKIGAVGFSAGAHLAAISAVSSVSKNEGGCGTHFTGLSAILTL